MLLGLVTVKRIHRAESVWCGAGQSESGVRRHVEHGVHTARSWACQPSANDASTVFAALQRSLHLRTMATRATLLISSERMYRTNRSHVRQLC